MDAVSNVRANGTHLLAFTDFHLSWPHCRENTNKYTSIYLTTVFNIYRAV